GMSWSSSSAPMRLFDGTMRADIAKPKRHASRPLFLTTGDPSSTVPAGFCSTGSVPPFEAAPSERNPMPFSRFSLHADVLKGIHEMGFTRPTPIQERAIPLAVAGHDVLACAMTGSGKSAAFLIPVLNRLMRKPRGTTRALVLTPTRELAAQIHAHLEELAMH